MKTIFCLLLLLLVTVANAAGPTVPPPPTTAFTRQVLTNTDAPGVITALGITITNATVIVPPDNNTTATNGSGALIVTNVLGAPGSVGAGVSFNGFGLSNVFGIIPSARTNAIIGDQYDVAWQTYIENTYWQNYLARKFQTDTQFIDTFTNLASWSFGGSPGVTNNFVYSTDGSGCNGNRGFVLGPTESGQIVAYFYLTTNSLSGQSAYTWVGINWDTAGGAPAGGAVHDIGFGVSFNVLNSGAYVPLQWETTGSVRTNILSAGMYKLEVNIDPLCVSFILMPTNHSAEYRYQYRRAGTAATNINNVNIWVSDSRGTNSIQVRNVAARKGTSTWSPTPWISGENADWVIWTQDGSSNKIRCVVPFAYDCNIPARLLYHGHGYNGQLEQTIFDQDANETTYINGIITNGTIVVASDQGGNTSGNDTGIQAVRAAVDYARTNFSVSSIFLMGESGGGLATFNYLKGHYVKVDGFIGIFPVLDLWNFYTNANSSAFSNTIVGNYSITGGNPAPGAWSGHDPMTMSSDRFLNCPMIFFGSTSDTTVPYAIHSSAMITKLSGWGREITSVPTTGNHGDASNYGTNLTSVINFMQRNSLTR